MVMFRNILFFILNFGLVILLSACSRSPKVNFYTLESKLMIQTASKNMFKQSVIIGPITLPEIVDRPQLVLRVAPNRVEISEIDRWAEPLKSEIPRIIADDLGNIIASKWVYSHLQNSGMDPGYRIVLDFTRFEAIKGDAVNVEAKWSMREALGKTSKSGYFYIREIVKADGYDSVISAYGRALYALSQDLAKELRAETSSNR